ncbi:hypothetical protein T11_11706 [Trichinella zimbabwensis]|uniref:Uncharacterized protein n=1 Tax=Trichinella zimbabwensis TaxID=268475 RepID=A0A0V1I5P0_9BILA|nr:hypothetical protein T11_11706 [Trichinella zimbabwensis]
MKNERNENVKLLINNANLTINAALGIAPFSKSHLFHISKLNTFQQIDDKFHPRSTCKATLTNIQWKFTNQIHQSFSKYNPIFRSETTTVEKPMLRSECY